MTPAQLELAIRQTGLAKLREVTSDDWPDAEQREAVRAWVVENAEAVAYPPLVEQAGNLGKALAKFVKSGLQRVDDETYRARLAICLSCPLYDAARKRCTKCGCKTEWKLAMASEACPEGKWSTVAGPGSDEAHALERGGQSVGVPGAIRE